MSPRRNPANSARRKPAPYNISNTKRSRNPLKSIRPDNASNAMRMPDSGTLTGKRRGTFGETTFRIGSSVNKPSRLINRKYVFRQDNRRFTLRELLPK